jgi:hypothetical protein
MKLASHLFVSNCDGHMYDTRKVNWSSQTPLRKDYARIPRRIDNTIALRAAIRNPYAWPGGYELFFVTSDGALLCHDCVKKEYRSISSAIRDNRSDGWKVEAITLDNELESEEYCAHCNRAISTEQGGN